MCQSKSPMEFSSLLEVADYFKDDKVCLQYIEKMFWGGKVWCPFCNETKVVKQKDGRRIRCSSCKEFFSLRTGTIFQDSNVPLRKWFLSLYLMMNNTRGISSYQLAKQISVTQKTAWFMLHRIRKLFKQTSEKLSGTVIADETFAGGKNKNRHIHKKVNNRKDRTFKDKVTVIGLITDDGFLKCEAIKSTKIWHLQPAVKRNVEKGSHLVSDEWPAYKGLGYNYGGDYFHSVVNHKEKKYKSEDGYSSNKIENVWSNLKKMLIGTYNRVSPKHFNKYLDEFVFRFNNRKDSVFIKFEDAIRRINSHLPYHQLVYGKG